MLVDKYLKEINTIRELIKPIVDEYYPSKANRETITLYDLITVGILAHLHFNRIIKHAYTHLIQNSSQNQSKLIERLNRRTPTQNPKLRVRESIRRKNKGR